MQPMRCSCGYYIHSTQNSSSAYFKELFETDFLHVTDLRNTIGWRPQEFNATPLEARGPYGKNFRIANVVVNPLVDSESYTGDSLLGGDAGLQLWSRSAPVKDMLGCAEIASVRHDMLYGSFRVGLKASNMTGTCGAFFWYSSDTQEIDVEFLSKEFKHDESRTNFVLQTPQSKANGFDASKTPFFKPWPISFRPDGAFHEYRFDWLPDKVSYFIDGEWQYDMREGIPKSPGHLVLNHWSNGDKKWSAGPPKQDAVMTVSYVKAYFNSTDPLRLEQTQSTCGVKPLDDANVCAVPDDDTTFFFTKQKDVDCAPGQIVYGGSAAKKSVSGLWTLVLLAVLLQIMFNLSW